MTIKLKPLIFKLLILLLISSCATEKIEPIKKQNEAKDVSELSSDRRISSARTGCSSLGVYSTNFTVTRVDDVVYESHNDGARVTTYEIELTHIQGDMAGSFSLVLNHGRASIKSVGYSYDEDLNYNGTIEANEVFYVDNFNTFNFRLGTLCRSSSGKLKIKLVLSNPQNREFIPVIRFASLSTPGHLPAYFGTVYTGTSSNTVTAQPIYLGYTYINPTVMGVPGIYHALTDNTLYWVNNIGGRHLHNYINMSGIEAISATFGYIWFVKDDQLWRLSIIEDDGTGIHFKSIAPGWGGSEIMAGSKDYLYTVHQGTLYKTTASDLTTISLGSGWGGIEALAVGPDYVYGVQGGHLWRQSKTSSTSWNLGGNWWGVEAMTYNNGYLYLVHQDKLKRVNISNGSTTVVEGYGWAGTAGLVGNGGSTLFALQGGKLWETSVNGGSTQIGPADWSGAQFFFGWPSQF